MLKQWLTRAAEEQDVFLFLLGYRWLSIFPAFMAFFLTPERNSSLAVILLVALAENLFITIFYPRVNQLLLKFPATLGIDLFLTALLILLTGGTASPYYLYALSPILAAAFFFGMRGGLVTASAFTIFYLAALIVSTALIDMLQALTQVMSFYLIATLFGYAALLLERIRHDRELLGRNNAVLERTNRELTSIHNLALTMQSSAIDVADIQEIILTTITNAMGFERAMLAMIDPDRNIVIGWLTHYQDDGIQSPTGLFHTTEIPLQRDAGLIAQTILNHMPVYVADGLPPTNDPAVNRRLGLKLYAVLPLYMREHPIGVLIADNPISNTPIHPESMHSLELVADQAAIALGSTKLCIERAQRLAIEEERNRLAMEIHDTATQSLFGIVYTLDGCIKVLPNQPDQVRTKLADLRDVATRTMNDLRRSVYDIWSGELSAAEFKNELNAYLQKLGAPQSLNVEIQIDGTFSGIGNVARKNLLRIAEESLANVVKHSQATHVTVSLDLAGDMLRLVIADNGQGFEVNHPEQHPAGFGLVSIHERAHAMGAQVEIESHPGKGTRVQVQLANCAPMPTEMQNDAHSVSG